MPLYSTACPLPVNRKIFRHRASAPFSPANLSGLSLWLKADAGITTGSGTPFISSIVISGAGSTTSNGTYTRTSGGYTTFTKSGGNYIAYGYNSTADGDVWAIYDATLEYTTYYAADEGSISAWVIDGGAANAPSSTSSNTTPTVVTTWADQSGNANNATPPDLAPTFISSSINSKPAISFNNDGSWMQIPQNNIGEDGNISIFIVMNYSSGYIFLNKGDAATFENTSWELSTITGFGFVNNDGGDFSWNTVPVSPATGTPLLLEGFSTFGVSQLAFNGTNSGDPSGENVAYNNISQYIGIGGGGDGGGNQGNPLNARIAEIIIYNREVTTPERQQVEAYLNTKYAIY